MDLPRSCQLEAISQGSQIFVLEIGLGLEDVSEAVTDGVKVVCTATAADAEKASGSVEPFEVVSVAAAEEASDSVEVASCSHGMLTSPFVSAFVAFLGYFQLMSFLAVTSLNLVSATASSTSSSALSRHVVAR